jgi:hypothetical protein
VHMETRMPRQPALYLGVFMGSVVVADQVQLQMRGHALVEQTQKLEPFLVSVTLLAEAINFAVGRPRISDTTVGDTRYAVDPSSVCGESRAIPRLQSPAPALRAGYIASVHCRDSTESFPANERPNASNSTTSFA